MNEQNVEWLGWIIVQAMRYVLLGGRKLQTRRGSVGGGDAVSARGPDDSLAQCCNAIAEVPDNALDVRVQVQ